MNCDKWKWTVTAVVLGMLLASGGNAQQTQHAPRR
jgi:hypothetical protein